MFRLPCAARTTILAVLGAAAAVVLARRPRPRRRRRLRRGAGARRGPGHARASNSSRRATARSSAARRWSSRPTIENFQLAPRHFGGEPRLGEGNIRFSLNRVPDCVDPAKLQKAEESAIGKGRLVGASFDYPRIRRPQRRARRTDRLHRQLLAGDPAGDLLHATCGPASTGCRRPSPPTTARPTPYHDVTNFQILEKPNHEIADCVGGKVSSAKAAAAAAED